MGFRLILCSWQESRTPMGAALLIGTKERADKQLSARRMMEVTPVFCSSRYEGEYFIAQASECRREIAMAS